MELDLATFRIKVLPQDKNLLLTNPLTRAFLENIFQLKKFRELHKKISHIKMPQDFINAVLQEMQIECEVLEEEMQNIPKKGPVIVVANNPSSIDGVTLAALMLRIRGDVRCLADARFHFFPQLKNIVLPVDTTSKSNPKVLRQVLRFLEEGGLLTITPAGALSHFQLKKFKILDTPWNLTFAKLIQATNVPVVPLYRSLHNSWKYHVARIIHPLLGEMLQPSEFINKQNKIMKIRIGKLIACSELSSMTPIELTEFLFNKTYSLGEL